MDATKNVTVLLKNISFPPKKRMLSLEKKMDFDGNVMDSLNNVTFLLTNVTFLLRNVMDSGSNVTVSLKNVTVLLRNVTFPPKKRMFSLENRMNFGARQGCLYLFFAQNVPMERWVVYNFIMSTDKMVLPGKRIKRSG